jgi:glyoxylase-like metal-dependent hydrolase (beta-lactamase superfamily II)
VQIGDITLHTLSDGSFRLDGGAMFGVVPRTLWERRTTPDARNRIALGIRPLLIQTGGQNVLVDAGIGDKMSAKDVELYGIDRAEHLEMSLAKVGLTPAAVDLVVATHLHFDHSGGFTRLVDGALRPSFPNARYVVQRGEWEDATHPHARNRASYLPDNFMPLESAGVLDLVDGDREVAPGVHVRVTGGHTRWHQMVQIESGGQVAVFAADLIPTAAHVDGPWIMAYDLYPMDTLAYKRPFLEAAIAGEYVIFFEHDPSLAAGIIRVEGGKYRVDPVA